MATCITTRSQIWALAAQPPLSPRYNPLSLFRSNWQGAEIINQFLCYTPSTGTTFFNGLITFSCFWSNLIFRLQTVRRISMRSHLSHALHTFPTHVCLMANLMPSNLPLFLTVHLHAVHGYAATHMCITHVHTSLQSLMRIYFLAALHVSGGL